MTTLILPITIHFFFDDAKKNHGYFVDNVVDVDVDVDVDVVHFVDNPILIYFCHLVQSLTHSGGSLLLRRIL